MISTLRASASAALLAVALVFSACASPDAGLSGTAGRDMQATVVAIAEHAAAGDAAAALAELDALQKRLDDARAADDITADRAALVQRSIDLVRADLDAVAAENATPTPAVTEDGASDGTDTTDTSGDGSTEDSGNSGNSGNSGDNGKDKGNSGKDNGKGKGNDKED